MQTLFTAQFMRDNKGCYSLEQVESNVIKGRDFVTATDILDCEIPTKDKYWFFCKNVFSTEQNQKLTILVAESVLHIYESKYPNDDRPRKAIQAANDYLSGIISREELINYRGAAYSSAAAAAAAYAAYAADDADSAAAAAAAAARKKNQELTAIICREILTKVVFEKILPVS